MKIIYPIFPIPPETRIELIANKDPRLETCFMTGQDVFGVDWTEPDETPRREKFAFPLPAIVIFCPRGQTTVGLGDVFMMAVRLSKLRPKAVWESCLEGGGMNSI